MLTLKLLREQPGFVIERLAVKNFDAKEIVNSILKIDEQRRATQTELDANLAKAIMSIGAVKGFEIGDGFAAADSTGSTNNDSFTIKDGRIVKKTNHSGGVLGGMSDGSDIIIRAAVKPTPSIARTQETVNKSGEDIEISIKGRHDPMIVPRAVVVVEAMTAVTLVDMIFANMTSRIDRITEFYKRD